ncbi:MAG: helix-turn-helix transcriptional regulator [Candidatus Nanopelagicales bacterium]
MEHVLLSHWAPDLAAQAFPDAVVVAVRDTADVATAVEAASRGERVAACLDGDDVADDILGLLVAELRRTGEVEFVNHPQPRPVDDLPADAVALLQHLAAGRTLGEAARLEHVSRRTADRRVAAARRILGVRSTAEAVAALRSAGVGTGGGAPAPRRQVSLVGRDADLALMIGRLTDDRSVVLVGEGGVGKTALLRAAAAATGRARYVTSGQETLRWSEYRVLGRALPDVSLVGDVEAVAARVERVVGPGVLVVDDVHLVDEGTLAVLCALSGRVTLLLAARPDDEPPGGGSVVHGPVARLTESGIDALPVASLPDAEVARLATSLAPGLVPTDVERVVQRAGGLPLLVEFLCGDPTAPMGRGLVPAVESLPGRLATCALGLALADRPLPPDDNTDALVRAGIATRTEDGAVRIHHALVADAVVAAADPEQVREVHRTLAAATDDPAAAAAHLAAAGDAEPAVARALEAAGATDQPVDRARMLQLAADACQDERREALWLWALEAWSTAGRPGEVVKAADRLDPSALSRQDAGRLALARARALWHLGSAEEAVAAARAGTAVVEGTGTAVEAALLGELVTREALSVGPRPEHEEMLARALALTGEGPGRAALLNAAGILAYIRQGEGLAEWSAGRDAARDEGDVDALMRTSNNVVTWQESNGDQEAGLTLAHEMAGLAAQLGLGEWQAQFRAMAANLLMFRGCFREALEEVDAVLSAAVDRLTLDQSRNTRALCLIELGLVEAAEALLPALPPAVVDAGDAGLYLLHAWAHLAAGRPALTVEVADAALRGDVDEYALTYVRGHLQPLRAWAQHDLGQAVTPPRDASPTRIDRLLVREAWAVTGLAEDPARAAAELEAVADAALQRSFGLALRARWGAAEARRLVGDPGAVDALLRVEEAASEAAMAPLLARVHRSLRLAGVPRAARRAPDRSGLLTERERMVLDLVARGATYTDIARRLGVGRPTVRRLVENARTKLGAPDRLSAVAAMTG